MILSRFDDSRSTCATPARCGAERLTFWQRGALAIAVAIASPACGSSQVQVGTSWDATSSDGAESAEESEAEQKEHDGAAHDADTTSTSEDTERLEEAPPEEPKEAALARAALYKSSPPQNHLGLSMAISQRVSDLPWVLAIENRSPGPIQLAALPELLSAEITPPETAHEEASAPEKPTKATSAKAPKLHTCGAKSLPKSVSEEDTVILRPGELIFHAFDPRDLCEGEEHLQEGARVRLTYGFPLQTKNVWQGGKLTTVETEQKAPFVAERKSTDGEVFLPLKHMIAEEFTLDKTYPLSLVEALPQDDEEGDALEPGAPPEPPPLTLTISPLGTTSSPESGLVEVRIRNTSGKTMQIFVRREQITYFVAGPLGEATCQMHPADRSPDPSGFSTLSPGESTTLQTRLAEACPAGTWDFPGTYSVSAFYLTTTSGAEHGLSAFTGSASTKTPARLVVPSKNKTGARPMTIVPSAPPKK